MDVVPERDSLIVEAHIAVDDIVNVHPDMNADVHLIAYKQRITPVVRGKVMQVSADRLTEKRTDNPYYCCARANRSEGSGRAAPGTALSGYADDCHDPNG